MTLHPLRFEKYGNYSPETEPCKIVPPPHFGCHCVSVPLMDHKEAESSNEIIHEMEKLENKIRGTFHVPYRLL